MIASAVSGLNKPCSQYQILPMRSQRNTWLTVLVLPAFHEPERNQSPDSYTREHPRCLAEVCSQVQPMTAESKDDRWLKRCCRCCNGGK